MTQVFKMDEVDRQILGLLQKEPNLTHTEIATKVNRSQPTVGMRIKKLEESGVLQFQAGINMKNSEMCFARVEIQSNKPEKLFEIIENCPFMLNAFRLSGTINMTVLIVGYDYKILDEIVNLYFRNNPDVIKVSMDIVTDIKYDLILPMKFDFEHCSCDSETKANCKNAFLCVN